MLRVTSAARTVASIGPSCSSSSENTSIAVGHAVAAGVERPHEPDDVGGALAGQQSPVHALVHEVGFGTRRGVADLEVAHEPGDLGDVGKTRPAPREVPRVDDETAVVARRAFDDGPRSGQVRDAAPREELDRDPEPPFGRAVAERAEAVDRPGEIEIAGFHRHREQAFGTHRVAEVGHELGLARRGLAGFAIHAVTPRDRGFEREHPHPGAAQPGPELGGRGPVGHVGAPDRHPRQAARRRTPRP